MLYAVAEIAVFMVGATIVGFLIGRITKRRAPRKAHDGESAELEAAQLSLREMETERASLRSQLIDAKERVRQLAAEPTAAETSEAANHELEEQNSTLEAALHAAEEQADRLRATIAQRDSRIAELAADGGSSPAVHPAPPLGYSSSAGTFADMRISFGENDEEPA